VGQSAGPDEQDPLVQAGQVPAGSLTEGPDPVHRSERQGNGVDEERHHRHLREPTEEDLQWLHRAVVDLHPQRHGQIDAGVQGRLGQPFGDAPRDVERSWGGTEVADRGGRQADAELRHQLVEEPVVVVGPNTTTNSGSYSVMNFRAAPNAISTSAASSAGGCESSSSGLCDIEQSASVMVISCGEVR